MNVEKVLQQLLYPKNKKIFPIQLEQFNIEIIKIPPKKQNPDSKNPSYLTLLNIGSKRGKNIIDPIKIKLTRKFA